MKITILLLLFCTATIQVEGSPNDSVKKRISKGFSLSPIVGYDPNYGYLFGGAVFRGVVSAPYSNASAIFYATLKKNATLEVRYKIWDRDRLFLNFESTQSNFFDPYYGEGDSTDPNSRLDIDLFRMTGTIALGFSLTKNIILQARAPFRYRDEHGISGDTSRRLFGTEFRQALGLSLDFENRDNVVDTHNGFLVSLSIDAGPGSLSSKAGSKTFVRSEADVRVFFSPFNWLVVATEAKGGTITGDAGYLFRFNLGGNDTLRGYPGNRFRGNVYYLTQLETRFRLLRWLSIATFAAAGDIGDQSTSDFNGPRFTKGVGLRIGLPPDFVAKARLDFGFASDQQSIYLSFNEAF